MSTTPSLRAAQAARRRYSTTDGARARVAEIDAEMDRVGARMDAIRSQGETVPGQLRQKLRTLAVQRHRYIDRAVA